MDDWDAENNSFNFTDDYEDSCGIFLGTIVPWSLTVYVSFTVIGATANALLLFAIYKDPLKCFRTPTTYFIVNLAIADLFSALYYMEEMMVSQTEYKSTVCLPGVWETIHTAIANFVYFLPFPSVVVLALERYVSIAHPLWHQVKVTSQLCRVAIIAVWTVNCVFTAITVILYDNIEILITLYPSICYVTTVCIYFMAFLSIRRQRLTLATDNSKSESVKRVMKTRLNRQKRFLTTVLIINVILIFVIPTIIGSHWANIVDDTATRSAVVLFYLADILFFINMVANPFLYVWRLPKYRKTLFVMYCCKK